MSGPRCLPKVCSGRRALRRGCALFIWALSLYSAGLVNGMRITSMTAPAVVDLREKLTLECKFDTGGEQLYAVKWYKDEQEFFRYKPFGTPPMLSFPVAGVHLRAASSNCSREQCRVVLDHLSRDHSGGTYRCEVSGEAPAFRIASETQTVIAAALPVADLRIENLSSAYSEGQLVAAECISAPSDPAPILSWYINGAQVSPKHVGEMNSSRPDLHGLVSRSLSLRFPAEKKMFQNDKMVVACRSTLPGISISPQISEKVVLLKGQAAQSVIKNQKLHWLSASGAQTRRIPSEWYILASLLPISVWLKENLLR